MRRFRGRLAPTFAVIAAAVIWAAVIVSVTATSSQSPGQVLHSAVAGL